MSQLNQKRKAELINCLLRWWRKSGRKYPWRREKDPYKVLIAELMLQRTRADQVLAVYPSFLRRFPTVRALAEASPEEVRNFFNRLGLVWRSENVKRLGEVLEKNFGGRVPDTREKLLSLPGVGEYVADAVLASLYGKNVAAVDANVCRVVQRIFKLKIRGEARRNPKLKQIVQKMVPKGRAKEFNWAMIDLGALVCTPKNPKCPFCPLNKMCKYASRKEKKRCSPSILSPLC